jgi:8-oxo-dGTP diphosphatase
MEYENPCNTSDVIVERDGQVLLIKRNGVPFKDMWALPGGHLNYGLETLEETAARELGEETGLRVLVEDLKLMGVYSEPNRDPRGHYITHVYIVRDFEGKPVASDDASDAKFFHIENLPELAFDHRKILNDYLNGGFI